MRTVPMLMSPSALARKTLAVCLGVALSACSTLPVYQKPDVSVPAHYAGAAGWALATPADTQPRGPWWTVFGDSQLNELESRIDVSNQTGKKAGGAVPPPPRFRRLPPRRLLPARARGRVREPLPYIAERAGPFARGQDHTRLFGRLESFVGARPVCPAERRNRQRAGECGGKRGGS